MMRKEERKEEALVELLRDMFDTPERLRRFIHFLPGESSAPPFPEGHSLREMAFDAVDELRRRGVVDREFFERLAEERPSHSEHIARVRKQWLPEIAEWAEPPRIQQPGTDAPTVFVSYSRRDSAFYDELTTHLSVLQRKKVIALWSEGRIRAGDEWEQVINRGIEQARIIILLVSADFLASDFIWQTEFARALARHERGEAILIPVIVRACLWRETPIEHLQVLPADGTPIALSEDPDRAWIDVSTRITEVIRQSGAAS